MGNTKSSPTDYGFEDVGLTESIADFGSRGDVVVIEEKGGPATTTATPPQSAETEDSTKVAAKEEDSSPLTIWYFIGEFHQNSGWISSTDQGWGDVYGLWLTKEQAQQYAAMWLWRQTAKGYEPLKDGGYAGSIRQENDAKELANLKARLLGSALTAEQKFSLARKITKKVWKNRRILETWASLRAIATIHSRYVWPTSDALVAASSIADTFGSLVEEFEPEPRIIALREDESAGVSVDANDDDKDEGHSSSSAETDLTDDDLPTDDEDEEQEAEPSQTTEDN